MKSIPSLVVAVGVFVLVALIFNSESAAAALKEKNLKIKKTEADGRIVGATVTIQEADGGPIINKFQTKYPAATVLKVTASLNVKNGFYRVQLLNNGKTSLTLSAEKGKSDSGLTELGVDENGSISYKVLAKKAGNVVLNLSFDPISSPGNSITSQAISNAKTSGSGGELILTLNCAAGKKCILHAQNTSNTKAYKKITFEIEYRMMTGETTIEKIKSGIIEDALFPSKTEEWPLGLVFGEPPRNIKIKLLDADMVEPETTLPDRFPQTKDNINLTTISEKLIGN